MTEHDVTELLERATADLTLEPGLVTAGAAAGRRRRRRHLVGTAAATVAVLGMAGAGLTVALSGTGGDGAKAVDPASPSKPHQKPAPKPAPVEQAKLAVTAHQVPATFGSILPGAITELPNKEWIDASPIIDFQWNGSAVRVGLTADDYLTTEQITDPLQRCQELGSGDGCTPGRVPGSYEQSNTAVDAEDGGMTNRMLAVYLPNGWDVMIMETNSPGLKTGPLVSPEPPFTLDQLRDAAYSDAWFR